MSVELNGVKVSSLFGEKKQLEITEELANLDNKSSKKEQLSLFDGWGNQEEVIKTTSMLSGFNENEKIKFKVYLQEGEEPFMKIVGKLYADDIYDIISELEGFRNRVESSK